MRRWLTILVLSASCSGCMIFEEPWGEEPAPAWLAPSTAEPPCVQQAGHVSAPQTQEPELLQGR